MNEDVRRSRVEVSRRRALALGGTVSLGALIAACAGQSDPGAPASPAATA